MKSFRPWAIALAAGLAVLISVFGRPVSLLAQAPAEITLAAAGLTLEEVAEGVYSLVASTDFPPASPTAAICNGSIIIGSEGVLVVDPFQSEALAELMFKTVETLTDQPIRYVVNTHYHFDHSGGNAAAAALGYPIVGRGPIREFMLTRNLEVDPNATPPEVVINGASELWLGDRQVVLTEFDGHSGGTDLVVTVPDVNVLIAGDLLFSERIPFVSDGNLRVWQASLAQLEAAYPNAIAVPGHGPIGDRAALTALRTYLEDLEALALGWRAAGLSQAAAIARTTVPPQYADYLFQGLFPGNLEAAYQQITLGNDSAADIQAHFLAQAPALQAL